MSRKKKAPEPKPERQTRLWEIIVVAEPLRPGPGIGRPCLDDPPFFLTWTLRDVDGWTAHAAVQAALATPAPDLVNVVGQNKFAEGKTVDRATARVTGCKQTGGFGG